MFGRKIDLSCKICNHVFSTQGNLSKHLRNVHEVEAINIVPYSFDRFHNKCLEGCNTSYRFTSELRNHLKISHSIKMEKEILLFSTREEFEIWFSNLCDTGSLGYVRREFPDKNRIYLTCNRSGRIEVKWDNRKRALKSKGSCKLGHNCISQISLAQREDNMYVATYYKTHYGHETEVEHIRLPKKKRVDIAEKLSSGVPRTKILDMYRNNSSKDKVLRTNLITRKDISNIKTSYNINIPDGVGHENDISVDASSVDPSVDQPTGIGEVVLYEKQSDDSEALEMEEVCVILGENEESYTVITENSACSEAAKSVNTDINLDRDEIIAELNEIYINVNLCSDDVLEPILPQIKKKLKTINNFLTNSYTSKSLSDQEVSASSGEPAEKKIKKEENFPSAKRKTKKRHQIIVKPSESEADTITQNLNIISDHEYY